jgi:hypothetical protein
MSSSIVSLYFYCLFLDPYRPGGGLGLAFTQIGLGGGRGRALIRSYGGGRRELGHPGRGPSKSTGGICYISKLKYFST